MNQAELAQARHRTYALLSRLFLQGLTAEVTPIVKQLPLLAEALPSGWETNTAVRAVRAMRDQLQATHYSLFGLNLFPHETLFLTAERELGHATTQRVAQTYHDAGFRGDWSDGADHVGHELAFMAFLCGAEADAWRDGQNMIAAQIQQRQADFLQGHLLRWVVPLAIAIEQNEPEGRFFTAVAGFMCDFVADHTAVDTPPPDLLPPPNLLDDPDTRLKDIARYLLVPAYTGLVLTKASLNKIGRALDLPRGFGTRQQMLVTLLEGAGRYEQWLALIAALEEEVAWWDTAYGRVTTPPLDIYTRPWVTRLQETRVNLAQLRTLAENDLA